MIIILCFFAVIHPVSLVFVHIGNELPPYLLDVLAQARLFNKRKAIYVLANNRALKRRSPLYDQRGVHFIPIESFHQSTEHKEFLKVCWMKKNTRTGFWITTSERFFVLYDWMKKYNKKHVIHLENDTLLYADVDEFMPIFKKHYPGLAAVRDDDERCVPCFMYISNVDALKVLVDFFIKELKTKPVTEIWHVNDMLVIGSFLKTHNTNEIDNLPIIMPSYVKAYGLRNELGRIPKNPRLYYKNLHLFKSIFDGAALGQYLGGTIHGDLPGFISETNVFNPSKLDFIWWVDCQGRRIPYVRCEGSYFRINNLHIHSKHMARFLSSSIDAYTATTIVNPECAKNSTAGTLVS